MVSAPATDLPPVIERWLRVIETGDTDQLDDMLTEDAVFYSPAVFAPQRGRALAVAYLRAAEHMFSGTGFRYVEKWIGANSAVLHFAAEVDGLSLEGHRHDPLERRRQDHLGEGDDPAVQGAAGRHRENGGAAVGTVRRHLLVSESRSHFSGSA